jgi:Citrate lyase beta subunit
MTEIRLRRSVLFMPADNTRAIEKARQLEADALILDLEDAVAPDAKPTARATAVAALNEGGFGNREVAIRVNATDTPWHTDDLEAFAACSCTALVIPKAESASQIQALAADMDRLGYPETTALWLMAETPRGVLDSRALCQAHPRVSVLIMGTSDLSQGLRLPLNAHAGLMQSRAICVLAAREAGIDVLDGVCLDLNDETALRAQCMDGRSLGFDGKTLIHPSQIDTANAVFSPSDTEVNHARRIVDAWQHATADGQGLCVLDGQLIEHLHVRDAERILALAEAITH